LNAKPIKSCRCKFIIIDSALCIAGRLKKISIFRHGASSCRSYHLIFKKKEMSHSKNNLSIITILFFLGISLSQVSAKGAIGVNVNHSQLPCSDEAKSSQCCLVAQFWNRLSEKGDKFFVENPKSCCRYIGPKGKNIQKTGIKGVYCDESDNPNVTRLYWPFETLNKEKNYGAVFGVNLLSKLPKLERL
jgi:hypothetical protein